jgi:outer membrane protein OmpA-like peptidoglycan-associated protein
MFSAKNLVLIAFVVWSGICWNWYVCGIKEKCLTTAEAPAGETSADDVAVQETTPVDETPYVPPAASNISTREEDMEKVQVHESANLLVIHFPYNSTQKEADKAIDTYLTRLADQVAASGKLLVISGHTDFVGDETTNRDMAQKRAENIRNLLVKKGIPSDRITCRSYGESRPVATNDTPEGRYQNRRVEIVVSE